MTDDRTPAEVESLAPDLTGLPDDRGEERAYELAHDLFGYPPRPKVKCLGCGVRAEPYIDGCCWCCCMTGQRDMVKRNTLPHEWRRLVENQR